jgi:hypothetical protein
MLLVDGVRFELGGGGDSWRRGAARNRVCAHAQGGQVGGRGLQMVAVRFPRVPVCGAVESRSALREISRDKSARRLGHLWRIINSLYQF